MTALPRGGGAVTNRRREPKDSLDDFPTPPWATRALIEHAMIGQGWGEHNIRAATAWEPCANRGYMVRPLREYFREVRASDVKDYGFGYDRADFLFDAKGSADFIITNPPYKLAMEFALAALERARMGVALFCRSNWSEGSTRYQRLFSKHAPLSIATFVERVTLLKGRVDPEASTLTSYSWFIWTKNRFFTGDTRHLWIPPCRKKLERPIEDYPTEKPE